MTHCGSVSSLAEWKHQHSLNIPECLENKMCSIKQSTCVKVNRQNLVRVWRLLVYLERVEMGVRHIGKDRNKEGPIRKRVLYESDDPDA